jgi:hypothetical protein
VVGDVPDWRQLRERAARNATLMESSGTALFIECHELLDGIKRLFCLSMLLQDGRKQIQCVIESEEFSVIVNGTRVLIGPALKKN